VTLWILAAALAAGALVVAEVGSRWWIRSRSRYAVWPPGLRWEIHLDPAVSRALESRVRFEVNADGERGGDVGRSQNGLYRVLAAGGSPVECFALDQPTSWPGALERLLSTSEGLRAVGARRVHVGSIGHSGIASQDLDAIFERVLPQYDHLALIVIMVGGNDVFQWLEDGAPPALARTSVPPSHIFSLYPEMPFGWKPGKWAVLEVARRLRRLWLRPLEVRDRAGAWYATARKMRTEAKELRTTVPDPAVMLDDFEHHFRRLVRRATDHADRVLVARQPWFEKNYTAEEAGCIWHGGLGKAWKQTLTIYYSHDVLNRLMGLVDARAAAVADELGVEHLDLRPVLTPSLENYYDYVHYTPAGAALVAQAVAAAVLRRPPGAPSARPAQRSPPSSRPPADRLAATPATSE
jgi:lysophospholipase L1-like esterase